MNALIEGMRDHVRTPSAAVDANPATPAAASELVAACESAWAAIQRHHPEVPDVVIVLGSGVERGRLIKLGHWWGGRWIADGDVRGEVLLAGEALHLPAAQVFEVLLHEAAHGLNAARGIKDASRGGRYHNTRFRTTAEELGLTVGQMPPYGWARTSVGPVAAERYEAEIDDLGEAMRIARRLGAGVRLGREDGTGVEGGRDPGTEQDGDDRRRGRPGPAVCGCGRKLRMAPSVLAQGPVLCGLCAQEFTTGHAAHQDGAQRPADAVVARDRDNVERGFVDRRRAELTPEAPDAVQERAAGHHMVRRRVEDLTPTQHDGLVALLELGAATNGAVLLAEVGGWYSRRTDGDERPLLGTTADEVAEANAAARAMLKLDGTLTGTAIRLGDREVLPGELLMVGDRDEPLLDVDGYELPLAGVLGVVETTDVVRGWLVVDFAIHGRQTLGVDTPAGAALEYGYTEHATTVGAPRIDLRTLPDAPAVATVEWPGNVAELGW